MEAQRIYAFMHRLWGERRVVAPEEEHASLGLWRSGSPHLAPEPGAWDRSRIEVGSVIEVGDIWRIYYTSLDFHGSTNDSFPLEPPRQNP